MGESGGGGVHVEEGIISTFVPFGEKFAGWRLD